MAPVPQSSPLDSDHSQVLCSTENRLVAEHIKFILLMFEIRAAVIHRNPIAFSVAIAEVVVLSVDHARAHAVIENAKKHPAADWLCKFCQEPNPCSFDLCWNCNAVHSPDLPNHADPQVTRHEQPNNENMHRNAARCRI